MSTGTVQSLKLVSVPENLSWEWISWCDQAAQGAQAGSSQGSAVRWWQVGFLVLQPLSYLDKKHVYVVWKWQAAPLVLGIGIS